MSDDEQAKAARPKPPLSTQFSAGDRVSLWHEHDGQRFAVEGVVEHFTWSPLTNALVLRFAGGVVSIVVNDSTDIRRVEPLALEA